MWPHPMILYAANLRLASIGFCPKIDCVARNCRCDDHADTGPTGRIGWPGGSQCETLLLISLGRIIWYACTTTNTFALCCVQLMLWREALSFPRPICMTDCLWSWSKSVAGVNRFHVNDRRRLEIVFSQIRCLQFRSMKSVLVGDDM